jgi:hypothetical protein
MQTVLSIGKFIVANHQLIIEGLTLTMSGLITIFMLVPGEQPEKSLQKFVDFLSKFSKKPAPQTEAPQSE